MLLRVGFVCGTQQRQVTVRALHDQSLAGQAGSAEGVPRHEGELAFIFIADRRPGAW